MKVRWSDGQWEVLKDTWQGPSTPPGRLNLTSKHVFGDVGTVSAVWTTRVQCKDNVWFDTPEKAISTQIKPHIPLHSLQTAQSQVAPGAKIDITVILTAPAPESGTLVYISADNNKLIAPKFVEVLAGNTHAEVTLEAAADVKESTTVRVTATTIGKPQVLGITIQPPINP